MDEIDKRRANPLLHEAAALEFWGQNCLGKPAQCVVVYPT